MGEQEPGRLSIPMGLKQSYFEAHLLGGQDGYHMLSWCPLEAPGNGEMMEMTAQDKAGLARGGNKSNSRESGAGKGVATLRSRRQSRWISREALSPPAGPPAGSAEPQDTSCHSKVYLGGGGWGVTCWWWVRLVSRRAGSARAEMHPGEAQAAQAPVVLEAPSPTSAALVGGSPPIAQFPALLLLSKVP